MSRRERWLWGASALLMIAAARAPLHLATFALPVSNDDAIPLMMAERIRHGELSTILWNQPYNGTLDAYLLAPGLALAGPHAVFRIYEIACGVLQVLLIARLAGLVAGERAAWIAAVLAAVGTPYMALMAATGPTPNFLVPLLVGAIVLALGRRTGPDSARRLVLIGLVAGLAAWDSFLALPALAGAVLGFLVAGWRPRAAEAAWATAGAVLGCAPLLIARATGASGATPVTSLRPRWLWTAGVADLLRAAAGLFGLQVPLVVDGPERAALPAALAILLALALAAAVGLGATPRRAWPLLGWLVALAAAFALSRRTGGDEVRYLFGAAIPVLALAGAGIAVLRDRIARPPLAGLASAVLFAALVVPWLVGERLVLAAWRDPAHAAVVWQVPPLDAALATLREARIRSAYASLQFAGRLTVESGHAVIASQAWNERIPGDPLRFRDEVDLDPRPAWVLSNMLSRGMPRAAGFRQLLTEAGGSFEESPAGDMVVFRSFRPPYDEARPVPSGEISVRTLDGAALPAAVLDRDAGTAWTSPASLARGTGLVVALARPRRLSAVVLLVGLDPTPLGVPWVAEADGAVVARGPARAALQWVNGAPRAGKQALLVVPLRDRAAAEVRVLFQDAGPRLVVAEAFAYGPDEPARAPGGASSAAEAYQRVRAGDWTAAVRLYEDAARAEPDRASYHAAAVRARWRQPRRRWLDVESLDDGGAALFARR